MGYDLHITRKAFWADEDGPAISFGEWLRYAHGDADLQSDPDNPGGKDWLVTLDAGSWPIWWSERGEICTKNPGDDIIRKLVSIALALNARVLGDDDEIYRIAPSGVLHVEPR